MRYITARTALWPHGRGRLAFAATVALVAALAVAAFAAPVPWLLRHCPAPGAAIVGFLGVLVVLVAASGAAVVVGDPGVVPRSMDDHAVAGEAGRSRKISVRGRSVEIRWCDVCESWVPPRGGHCAVCEVCIVRWDHHCVWLGVCVGGRNYAVFFVFVLACAAASAVAVVAGVLHLVWRVGQFRDAGAERAEALRKALADAGAVVSLLLIVACGVAFLATAGLAALHVYLMARNLTTAEYFRGGARNASTDADDLRGCAAIAHAQCAPRPQSAVAKGYAGARYADEALIARLISEQVEYQTSASAPGSREDSRVFVSAPLSGSGYDFGGSSVAESQDSRVFISVPETVVLGEADEARRRSSAREGSFSFRPHGAL